jgi:hypothetical protein
MGNKEPNVKLDVHNVLIPYCFIVFGRTFEMPLTCVFGYTGDLKTNHALEIISLAGADADGLEYDMLYLVEDEGSLLTRHVISCILNNHANWSDGDVAKWW